MFRESFMVMNHIGQGDKGLLQKERSDLTKICMNVLDYSLQSTQHSLSSQGVPFETASVCSVVFHRIFYQVTKRNPFKEIVYHPVKSLPHGQRLTTLSSLTEFGVRQQAGDGGQWAFGQF